MEEKNNGQIMIECPNTIFHLCIKDELELSKIEIFMNNIRTVKRIGLRDIYSWCNRQGIEYYTRFNYNRESGLWMNLKSFMQYSSQKWRYQYQYQLGFQPV
jgi:hypothetical protein